MWIEPDTRDEEICASRPFSADAISGPPCFSRALLFTFLSEAMRRISAVILIFFFFFVLFVYPLFVSEQKICEKRDDSDPGWDEKK